MGALPSVGRENMEDKMKGLIFMDGYFKIRNGRV
jgi:hypothetical protein